MQPLRIFIGYDDRQPIAMTTIIHSIYSRSTKPVSITPLVLDQLPLTRRGLTPFTYSRFLVPWLCNYEGWGLFLDIDIILNDDIVKLFDQVDDRYSVLVSKNEKRFEWASVMLFNNAKCTQLTPDYVETTDTALHRIEFCKEDEVGSFSPEWNHLVGYDEPRENPSLIHYTQGIPAFPETDNSEHTNLWQKANMQANSATSWDDLMGPSVHAISLNLGNGRTINVPKYYGNKDENAILPQYDEKIKQLVEAKYGTS